MDIDEYWSALCGVCNKSYLLKDMAKENIFSKGNKRFMCNKCFNNFSNKANDIMGKFIISSEELFTDLEDKDISPDFISKFRDNMLKTLWHERKLKPQEIKNGT